MENTNHIPKIIAGVGVLFLLYVIINTSNPNNQSSGSNGGYIDEGDNSTTSDPKYIADNLHDAMKGINYNNTEKNEVIMTELAPLSQAFFAKVIQAFGRRTYNPYSGNEWGFVKHPLKTWLQSELSKPIYNQLKQKFPKYL